MTHTRKLYKTAKKKDWLRGADVTAVQQALKDAGYKIVVDGIFGTQTENRVKAYQKAQKLKYIDGIVGRETWGFLFPAQKTPLDIPETAHFKIGEFRCKDGTPVPEKYYGNLQELMNRLEKIRAELGDKPIKIVSGYRSPAYNAKLAAKSKNVSKTSQHLYARAADIRRYGKTIKTVFAACRKHNPKGGNGKYLTFVHTDVRDLDGKKAATW